MKNNSPKRAYYGPEANAATVRAMVENGLTPERAYHYRDLTFKTFGIRGRNSFRNVISRFQQPGAFEHLKNVNQTENWGEILDFLCSFLGLTNIQEVSHNTDEMKIHDDLKKETNEQELEQTEPTLHILNCELKTKKLQDGQRICYMDIVDKDFAELQTDFEYAQHLAFLAEDLVQDGDIDNFILLCERKEQGLLACAYLSGFIKEGDLGYEGEEFDFSDIIPIVYAHEITQWSISSRFNQHDEPIGQFGVRSASILDRVEPWWVTYDEAPLVVIISLYANVELLSEKIKELHQTHRQLWIIIEKGNRGSGFGMLRGFADVDEILWKLDYKAYKIEEAEVTSPYFQLLMKNAAARQSFTISSDVDLIKTLQHLKSWRGDRFDGNNAIIELINKAIAFKKKGNDGVLYPDDFAFMGLRMSELYQNKSTNPERPSKSAIDKMNQEIYGLDQVKKQITEVVNSFKARSLREKAGLKDGLAIHNTCVFSGPPGVGKTELANYFVKILFENNLLDGDSFLNISAAELKAKYVGHTAHKIHKLFEEYDAIFLDEVYSLGAETRGEMDIFSQEALAQLCVEMERHSRDKLIILAGYGGDVSEENNKMVQFLRANPGIASRITFHFNFPQYSPGEDLPEIFQMMVKNAGFDLEEGWRSIAVAYFFERARSEHYGNAREARRLLEQAATILLSRVGAASDISTEELKHLRCEDLSEAVARIMQGEPVSGRRKAEIGF